MSLRLSVVIAGGDPARRRTTLASVQTALKEWGGEAELIFALEASTRVAADLAKASIVALLADGDLVGRRYFTALLAALDEESETPLIVRPKATVSYGSKPEVHIRYGLESDAFRTGGLLFAAPFSPPLAARRTLLASLPDRSWDKGADWRWTAETLAMGVSHMAVAGAVHVAWTPILAVEAGLPGPHSLFTGEARPIEVTGRLQSWTPPELSVRAASSSWAQAGVSALDSIGCATPSFDAAPVLAFGVEHAPQAIEARRAGRRAAWLSAPDDPALPSWVVEHLSRELPSTSPEVNASEDEAWEKPGYAAAVAGLHALGLLPTVTAVLPNYNYAEHLAERLRQIDRQSLPVTEIVVLDDASSDHSLEVVRQVAPLLRAPVRLIINFANSGSTFRQWTRGAEAARGELVWIAEADDVADPDFLASLAPAFDDLRTVMAQCQSRQLNSEGEVVWEDYSPYLAEVGAERWRESFSADGRAHVAETLTTMNTIPNASAVVFRREALLAVLLSDAEMLSSYRLAGDWLVYVGVLAKGRFYFCDQVLNGHRVHPGSVTQSALTPLDRVLEVGKMQAEVRARSSPSPQAVAAATAYLQKLYDWFGLAAPGREHVYTHPCFARLRPLP